VSDGLDGKVCLVTGASRGIGAAIATRLAANNARVVVHYGHNKDLALQVLETLDGKGHFTLGADLADPAAAAELVTQVVTEAGQLDVLINNAGIFLPHPPLEVDAAEWLEKWNQPLVTRRALSCSSERHGGAGGWPHYQHRIAGRIPRRAGLPGVRRE
jgi:NAD(P)-dependent dehydrogenase (short-subunit alcohol dehydrogenase family)